MGKRSPKGYEVVKCAKCNDYKVRGGFRFEGDSIHYLCFNCGVSTGYDPSKSRTSIGAKLKEVLLAFGIPDQEIERSVSANFFKEIVPLAPGEKRSVTIPTTEVPLPSSSYLVCDIKSPWCEVGREYLYQRQLSALSDLTYVSDDMPGRILVPCWFRNRIVYWQGRAMDDQIEPRYKNPIVSTENVFYNMDEVYRYTDDPLFVSEGFFNAASIGRLGVALAGSILSDFKLQELKRAATRRKVIFVIDKDQNGRKLGEAVLDANVENFYLTAFPDNIDDANDALVKLGRLWTVAHLTNTATSGFEAKLLLKMKCKGPSN